MGSRTGRGAERESAFELLAEQVVVGLFLLGGEQIEDFFHRFIPPVLESLAVIFRPAFRRRPAAGGRRPAGWMGAFAFDSFDLLLLPGV